jgi:threonylcarbamoyladenosine tRNA methylthiotransferase MtaB
MKFCFFTFGCKLNQAESDMISADLISIGLVRDSAPPVDFIIINACSVTATAASEVMKKIKTLKGQYPQSKIILTGCFIPARYPGVDLLINNNYKSQFSQSLSQKFNLTRVSQGHSNFFSASSRHPHRAFIKIQTGCNNFCAYCIVPKLRGLPKSRPTKDIIQNIITIEKQGLKEVVLTGVNIGLYHENIKALKHKNNNGLLALLKLILSQTNIPRVRLGSLWPTHITPELIKLYASESRLCPHFHLSIQSGSDRILKLMNRSYRAKDILAITSTCRANIKNINFTCDIIVGFPGETDKDFGDTCELIEKIGFSKVHIFQFSPRPSTRAEKMAGQTPTTIKQARYKKLSIISEAIAQREKNKFKNKKLPVLWEGIAHGYQYGFTDNYLRTKKKVKPKENWGNKIENFKIAKISLS